MPADAMATSGRGTTFTHAPARTGAITAATFDIGPPDTRRHGHSLRVTGEPGCAGRARALGCAARHTIGWAARHTIGYAARHTIGYAEKCVAGPVGRA